MLTATVLTGVMRRFALARGILDFPNRRSSHSIPTPRGGGIAIMVASFGGITALMVFELIADNLFLGLFFGGLLAGVVGYLDDRGHIPAGWRLSVHFTAAIVLLVCAGSLPTMTVLGLTLVPGLITGAILLLLIVWILNLYNFMDGIDGIAGVEATTVGGCAAVLLWYVSEPGMAVLVAVYAVASFGFLIWNWAPAKIFMGDSGSGFLGFSLAALMVLSNTSTDFPMWSWLILLGVFIVDATVTLVRRVLNRERWYEPHRDHAYQHAAQRYNSHGRVAACVAAINIIWLFPLAALATMVPQWNLVFLVIAWLPLLVTTLYFEAGRRIPG